MITYHVVQYLGLVCSLTLTCQSLLMDLRSIYGDYNYKKVHSLLTRCPFKMLPEDELKVDALRPGVGSSNHNYNLQTRP